MLPAVWRLRVARTDREGGYARHTISRHLASANERGLLDVWRIRT